ncbi:hypothetical protein [endosymbiont of Lamellibrachia barhami]|uniref:hypothetical protein n=1 Tax=endosymbiont of Lamellibrachia barhami TaxID=205975 RepID=UPI0015AFD90D|nr:hypothetical protein [endosymbiont of Lamellibrachia barhami]
MGYLFPGDHAITDGSGGSRLSDSLNGLRRTSHSRTAIPAGTGLSYHNERRRKRQEELAEADSKVELVAEDVEQAFKEALNAPEGK